MRILQVTYCFDIGGSESVAWDIALNMTEGCTHGVSALEHDGPLRQVLEAGQVATFLIDKKPIERFSPMLRLWRAMRQFKPDVVHTHHLYGLLQAMANALFSLFSAEEQRVRLGMNGRRLVERCYDLKQSIAAYVSLYTAEVN